MDRAALVSRVADPSVRLIIAGASIAALVLAQVGLVIGGGVAANNEANRALSDSFEFLADVSEERVVTFAHSAEDVVNRTADDFAWERAGGDDPTTASVLESLHTALADRAELTSLAYTSVSGDYIVLSHSLRNPGGYSAYTALGYAHGVPNRSVTEFDPQLRTMSQQVGGPKFDARSTGCYLRASASTVVEWSEPGVDPVDRHDEVWVCKAVRANDGALLGVVSASIALDELGRQINVVPSGSDVEVFVLAGEGVVIAPIPGRPAPDGKSSAVLGAPPDVRQLDRDPSATAGPTDARDSIGTDSSYTTLERGMGYHGLNWVLHVRASDVWVNEGFTRLQSVLSVLVGGMVTLTALLAYLVWRMRTPLKAWLDEAYKDPLTGLYNRRYLEAKAPRLARKVHRAGLRLAVIMMDLDNFKAINDDLGHHAGDAALEDIAAAITGELRPTDLAVRWGGDEFLVLLALDADEDGLQAVERIRNEVDQTLMARFARRADLGVTAGFALSGTEVADIRALISSADEALIDGKWTAKGVTYFQAGAAAR